MDQKNIQNKKNNIQDVQDVSKKRSYNKTQFEQELINQNKSIKDNDNNYLNQQQFDINLLSTTLQNLCQSLPQIQIKQQEDTQKNNISHAFCKKNQISQFYINKLKYYPKEERTHYMVGLYEMLCEDPFFQCGNQPKKTVESLFMTTFGFEIEELENIAKAGIHVNFAYQFLFIQQIIPVQFILANDKDKDYKGPTRINNYEGYSNWTLILPPKNSPNQFYQGAFHPKLWLLKFPNFLRVVIGTGNLHVADWNIWSNALWYQDFQKKNESKINDSQSNQDVNSLQFQNSNQKQQKEEQKLQNQDNNDINFDFSKDFKDTLQDLIKRIITQDIAKDYTQLLKINLDDYIFDNIKVILISSIPERVYKNEIKKYGKGKVQFILQNFKTQKQIQNPVVTYQCTSLGKIDQKFINELFQCIVPCQQKQDKINDVNLTKFQNPQQKNNNQLQERKIKLQLIFPSAQYVQNSLDPDYANCLILNQDYYQNDSFPKDIFYQFSVPKHYFFHNGIIPHLKIFIVTDKDFVIDDDTVIYFGSHNITQAAWGRFEKQETQLSMTNTELGILLPPQKNSKEMKQEIINSLPFQFPPDKYHPEEIPYTIKFH